MRTEALHGVDIAMVPTQPTLLEAVESRTILEDDPTTTAAWEAALTDPNFAWVATDAPEGGKQ